MPIAETAAALQALLAVPGALVSLRDLAGSKPKVSEQLAIAADGLLEFSKIGLWLSEVKQYHEQLTHLDIAFRPLHELSLAPSISAGFDPDRLNRDDIFRNWNVFRNQKVYFPALVDLVSRFKYYTNEPLYFDSAGNPQGNVALVEFIQLEQRLSGLLRTYDPRSTEAKEKICDTIDIFYHKLIREMGSADAAIIEVASNLANTLRDLGNQIKASNL